MMILHLSCYPLDVSVCLYTFFGDFFSWNFSLFVGVSLSLKGHTLAVYFRSTRISFICHRSLSGVKNQMYIVVSINLELTVEVSVTAVVTPAPNTTPPPPILEVFIY